jgi:hypothetical protein
MANKIHRRNFLRGSAVGVGTVLLAAPGRTAAALTPQQVNPESPLGIDLANRCGPPTEHAALLAELEAKLNARDGFSGTVLVESMRCPICGCQVTASREVK